MVLKRSRARYPFVRHAFADGRYAGRLLEWARQKTHITLQIVRRNASTKGFEVLPRRWVVERTFAWIIKCHATSKEQAGSDTRTHPPWTPTSSRKPF